ncbi:MAG: hypothetical protein IJO63_02700 [Bacilli bacterium]|nr:hypothetical protein [Bacilli bacterium]
MVLIQGLLICSFIYALLLSIIYFSRSRLNNIENNIYKVLLTSCLFGTVLEFMCMTFASQMTQVGDKIQEAFHVVLVARFYLLYLLIWISFFMAYIYSISFDENKRFYAFVKKHRLAFTALCVVAFLTFVTIISVAPMYFYNDGSSAYTWGPSIDSLVALFTIGVVFGLLNVILGFKKTKFKRYAPVFIFFAAVLLIVVIKSIDPEIQLVGTLLTFVTILMYFTIENPDLHMLYELKENRQLIEKNYESNASFIFKISQEVKNPVDNISEVYNVLKDENDVEVMKKGLQVIKRNSDDLNFIVSNLLDVSTLDTHNIKIIKNKYNLHNLLRSIEVRAKQELSNDVDLRLSIASNVPEVLFGDEVKLKQILMTIILNSVKYTQKGFIEIDCSAIVKYDACRLIFTIEDSGCGMSLSEVNDLMNYEGSLNEEEIELLDKVDLNIKVVSKITKLIGGLILIKSEEDKGSKFTIILEQKIYNPETVNIPASEKYSKSIFNAKKVLLVSDVKDDLAYLKPMFSNNDFEVITSMYGKDCIDKINNKEYFDLIVIEDEMRLTSAYTTFKELEKLGNKVPVVVMVDKPKERIKKHYIADGFADVIFKSKIKSEVERIIKKYL